MTNYVITPPAQPALAVQGTTARFPVRRIYCVGQNYADHAIEMGSDPTRNPPFFFLKSADCLVTDGADFPYPVKSDNVHHEVELVVALKEGGRDIPVEKALDHVFGYAVGIDMTRRDLQAEAKKDGRPWELGKSFDHSAPCSALVPVAECGHLAKGTIALSVNGETRQSGDLNQMIWKVAEAISYLSTYFTLYSGDLLFTGTPAGVGPVRRGDEVVATIEGLPRLSVRVV
ncbi:fumarylacetoacetate hydrolase family protein [Daeguia caeni]|uniref:Fumarylacetoacetate hydrolase family protein n=1 Tax=Daeguia caeni TaxID=439612 RepID=A0ABV9H7Z5_9HYPH